jgi:hypothetical protein
MRYRILFTTVTMLFVTMNVLLWRSEWAGRGRFGAGVPTRVVWEKVLTSPDNSFLEIRHHGAKIGRANWVASIEEAFPDQDDPELPPEGMVKRVTGYRLDFDGSLTLSDFPRARFYMSLKLDTNQTWKEFDLRVNMKPLRWEITATADAQQVRISTEDDEGRNEFKHSFAELRQPETILRDLGGPGLPALLGLMGFPRSIPAGAPGAAGFQWDARLDRLPIGRTSIRVYCLEARLLDRYKAVLLVSPVGEILRVELPDEILLINEGMGNF